MEDKLLEAFKSDVARFSGNYQEFLVIVKTTDKRIFWRCTDKTWGLGASHRYMNCNDAEDTFDTAESRGDGD